MFEVRKTNDRRSFNYCQSDLMGKYVPLKLAFACAFVDCLDNERKERSAPLLQSRHHQNITTMRKIKSYDIYKCYLVLSALKTIYKYQDYQMAINRLILANYIQQMKLKGIFQKEIKELIETSDGTQRSIQNISDYCINLTTHDQHKINEIDIAKWLQTIVLSNKLIQVKLKAVHVMTEILAGKSKMAFVKHLSARIQAAITNNKMELERDPTSLRTFAGLLQRWRNENIFSETFIKKMQLLAGNQVMQNMSYHVTAAKITKYSISSLKYYRDAHKNAQTTKIYKDCVRFYGLRKQVKQITEKSALASQNKLTQTQAKIMLQKSQILLDNHIQTLRLYQDSIKLVQKLFEDEAKKLNLAKADLERQQE